MNTLSDVTIFDLTHMLSGPYGSQLLADMGANCIKVEPPGKGEGTRKLLAEDEKYSIEGVGAYFLTLSRNKKSICIDLKKRQGLELFYDLVKHADVVINNFGEGVPKRLGIDYDTLKQHNPGIITCSITGEEGAAPLRAGIPIGDLGGGMFATMGILAALHARNTSGSGQHIDISMQDCQVSMLNYMATMYLMSGVQPPAVGNSHFVHVPYGTFKTQSRYLIVACMGDTFYQKLAILLDDPELMDEKFATQPMRWEHRHFINQRVQQHFEKQTCEYWLEQLKEHRIPAAPVNDFEHALNDPQIVHRQMVVDVPLQNGQTVKQPGNPIKLSGAGEQTFTPPPTLGQHTGEVLQQLLDLSPLKIKELKENGVIA